MAMSTRVSVLLPVATHMALEQHRAAMERQIGAPISMAATAAKLIRLGLDAVGQEQNSAGPRLAKRG